VSRKRLLLQSPLPPPSGGIATWTRNLLAGPLADRWDIHVVDVNAGSLDVPRSQVVLRKVGIAARAAAQFSAELVRHRPHVVHMCTSAQALGILRDAPLLRLASASGAATVLHVHGSASRLGARPDLLPLMRRLLAPVDALGVLNQESLVDALSYGFPAVQRIPNSIARRPAPERDWPPRDRPVRFLFVGWLMPAKGLMELLQAMRTVPNAELTLLGRWVADADDVVHEDAVRAAIDEPELAGRVHLPGEVSHDQVWDFYDQADVFVLPSWTEGFPMTLLESMMAGLPAIVSRVGAMPEAVSEGESGFVVEPRDAEGLARVMRHVVANKDQIPRWGDRARQTVLERYTHDVVYEEMDRLWRGLIGR